MKMLITLSRVVTGKNPGVFEAKLVLRNAEFHCIAEANLSAQQFGMLLTGCTIEAEGSMYPTDPEPDPNQLPKVYTYACGKCHKTQTYNAPCKTIWCEECKKYTHTATGIVEVDRVKIERKVSD